MSRAALAERFRAHLDQDGLLAGPGLALLAVSGGPDSMALLDLCAGVAAERSLSLQVLHADHGIHEESSAVAEQVARSAQERYGLACVSARLALGAEASETQAREARYDFFRRLQRERDARWLVTAHHADDQAETVLLRLLRGSAPAGLAGIAAAGPGGLVRPLLPFRRDELAEHARAAGLPVFVDPANADPRHTRSWLRTAVLPLLAQRMGDAGTASLLSVAGHAADELAAWDAALDVMPGLDVQARDGRADVARPALGGYDSQLAARLVRAAAHRAGLMLGPAQAARVVHFAKNAVSGKALELGEGLTAEIAFDRLVLTTPHPAPSTQHLLGDTGQTRFGDFAVQWRRDAAPDRLSREGWSTWIADGPLEVRLPAPGSRITPLGGNGHRTVARLLMEGRVPRSGRAGWPLVFRDGEPVWIPGICRGSAAVPAPGSLAVRMDIAPAS